VLAAEGKVETEKTCDPQEGTGQKNEPREEKSVSRVRRAQKIRIWRNLSNSIPCHVVAESIGGGTEKRGSIGGKERTLPAVSKERGRKGGSFDRMA